MRLVPKISLEGLADYVLFVTGVTIGAVLFSRPMEGLENLIANLLKRQGA